MDRILSRSLQGGDLFNVHLEVRRELLKLESEQFDPAWRTEFALARAAFDRLSNLNKHQSLRGSMVYEAASKLRPVLDHFIRGETFMQPKPRPDLLVMTVNPHETRAVH